MSKKQLVASTEPLDGEIIGPTGDKAPRTIKFKVGSEDASGVKERLVDIQSMATETTDMGVAVPPKAPITIDLQPADQSGPPAVDTMTPLPNFDPIAVGDEVAGLSSKMIAVDSIGVPPERMRKLRHELADKLAESIEPPQPQ